MPAKRSKEEPTTASASEGSGEEVPPQTPTKAKRQKKVAKTSSSPAATDGAQGRAAPTSWTPEEEKACLIGLLAHLEVTLTPQAKQWLITYSGRTHNSIHGWYYKKVLPRLQKAKEQYATKAESETANSS